MDPASPLLSDAGFGDTMPGELLAAFVEAMLGSSLGAATPAGGANAVALIDDRAQR